MISKVLVARLRPILQRVVGPFQNSFLAGSDNILIVQEMVHNLKGRGGSMILKLSIHKAYDTVSWSFLHDTLLTFGFPTHVVSLIMYSVSHMKTSILWNGEMLPEFFSGRGLRQGDPISPYFFLLVMERLSHMILDRVEKKAWKPLKASRRGPSISHLCRRPNVIC